MYAVAMLLKLQMQMLDACHRTAALLVVLYGLCRIRACLTVDEPYDLGIL